MDERAELCGLNVAPDAFVFSLTVDCSAPMPPDYVTKRVATTKLLADISPKHYALHGKRASAKASHTSSSAARYSPLVEASISGLQPFTARPTLPSNDSTSPSNPSRPAYVATTTNTYAPPSATLPSASPTSRGTTSRWRRL
jgi:hypothetical protein